MQFVALNLHTYTLNFRSFLNDTNSGFVIEYYKEKYFGELV